MTKYRDRKQAGKVLAEALRHYANRHDVLVLALPRGGVPVAYEVANALQVPLDVFIVRKLGVPGHTELAMGAIASGGTPVFNQSIIKQLQVSQEAIEKVIAKEKVELQRREIKYRASKIFPIVKDKIIILVDDGIATGATMRAAIKALREMQAEKIVVAVPVAALDTYQEMEALADEVICLLLPEDLMAVGAWYDDFSQTEDEEVFELLTKARHW